MIEAKDRDLTSSTFEEYRAAKIADIKLKTGQLISVGFVFDGETFPATPDANFNYNVMKVSKSDFTFPKNIGTITGVSYSLTSANVNGLWSTAKDFIEPILDSHRDLINAVSIATDHAGVDAVIDAR